MGSMDPGWLSKAYLVYDEPGGTAVFVDSGAPLGPLLAAVEQNDLAVTHLLTTHGHGDHVSGDEELVSRFGIPIVKGPVETGKLRVQALATPGHSDDGLTFVVNGEAAFTGDTLFKDAVGGGDFETVKSSVMDVLMALPHDTHVYPGHTDETTIGARVGVEPIRPRLARDRARGHRAVHGRRRQRDADRLVARLRRQGQGVGAVRRRP